MSEEKISPVEDRFIAPLRQSLPPTAVVIIFPGYVLLNLGCVLLMANSSIIGIVGLVMVNLIAFLLLRPRWVVPLYILIAGPSVVIPLGTSGILSRLFVGNLMFALLIAIGLLYRRAPQGKSGQSSPVGAGLVPVSLMVPLIAQVLVGLASIIYSRLQPDPRVVYSFPHASVPLTLVNTIEMVILLGLPLVLMSVSGFMRTMRDVQWIVRAFIGTGMLYALGTIFAGPLRLYSQLVILGVRRPEVFGLATYALGMLLVCFTCIALGQALYAHTPVASVCWWLCTIIFSVAVILSFSRESWLALCISVLGMIGFRTKSLLVLCIMKMLLISLFVPGVADFFNPEKVYGLDRLIIWQDAIAIWQGHPYFGVGAGNFQFFDIAYGTEVVGIAHNQYLEVLAEMGVQGLLCLLWSLGVLGRFMLQRFSAATTLQGKAIALAYIGYYMACILGGFFSTPFLPSAAGGGGTLLLLEASYHWLLIGLVLTIPLWEKSASVQDANELDRPVKESLRSKDGLGSTGHRKA